MNAEALESEEQIMDAYRGAVAHAKGDQFASMLQVSHAGGWFTVRDLEGTESRYRKKEIISLTRNLLKQPKFGIESRLDLAALVDIPRQVPPPPPKKKPVPEKHIQNIGSAQRPEVANREPEASHLNLAGNASVSNRPSPVPAKAENQVEAADADAKITPFPLDAASPGLKRQLENKTYFRNLRRIVLIVATIIGFVVLVIALKRH